MRAGIYTRQSLDKNGDGLAVARQLAENERLCEQRGWKVVARESDNDISGYSGKARPGYQRIIALMESKQVDVVVVWAVDRLTRKLADLVTLIDLCERTGVKIATVSGDLDLSTESGRLVARILGSVAQGEVETKAKRQRAAARQAAEAGAVRSGCPRPFGWLEDRKTMHPQEGPAVADACRALLAGGTISGVCRDWTARGLRPHQAAEGKPWTRNSITTILKSARNAGISTYRGEEVGRGTWQPLISEETYRAVMQLLDDPARKRSPGVRTVLGGLATCCCGNSISASSNALGQQVYRCNPLTRGDRPGPHVSVRADRIDEIIGRIVIGRLTMPDAVDLVTPKAKADTSKLRDEAQAIRARLARLGPLFALGDISEQDMVNGRRDGARRLAEIEGELAILGHESALAPLVAAENLAAEWERLGADRKRAVVSALMNVELHPAGRGARVIDPDRVIKVTWKEG